jgi:hypothetical protein
MSGEIAPMIWFLFWVCLSIGDLGFGFFTAIISRTRAIERAALFRLVEDADETGLQNNNNFA